MDPVTPPSISVTRPVGQAMDWMHHVLFSTFDLGKWFVLGFCAWLAWLGQNGPGFSGNWTGVNFRDTEVDRATNWVEQNIGLVAGLAAVGLLLLVGLIVLVTWLSSRGKFVFLDGTIHNRGEVAEPWDAFRQQADRLFWFRIVVGLIAGGILLLVFSVLGVGIWSLEKSPDPAGSLYVAFFVFWIAVLLVVVFGLGLVGMAINDFVVPIMWVRDNRSVEAWSEFAGLLGRHLGAFIRYVLMKIVLGLALAVVGCLVTCLTCCVAALPYIGAVILLPLYVIRRSFSIYFLSQLHPDFASLAPAVPSAPTPAPQAEPPTPADAEPESGLDP